MPDAVCRVCLDFDILVFECRFSFFIYKDGIFPISNT